MDREKIVEFWDDDKIVDGILSGDRAAAGQLIGKYGPRLWSFLVRTPMHKNDAEEAISMVIEKAIRGMHTFKRGKPLFTWLATIAKNVRVDRLRSGIDQVPSDKLDFIEDQDFAKLPLHKLPKNAFGGGSSLGEHKASTEVAALREVLSKIGESDRVVLELELFVPISREDMARMLSVDVGTLRVRICRAQKKFIALLKEHPVFKGRPVNPDWAKEYVK
ncbi:MAG: RNA polymerase sigma factor [Armatimonadetes bacterium]|nr:RNA polymerase sigma factor [Armatimonadota bacterium]